MPNRPQIVTIDGDAIAHLLEFCQATQRTKLLLVADHNTYVVQGKAVESALRQQGFDLKKIVFTHDEVAADAHHILRVWWKVTGKNAPLLLSAPARSRTSRLCEPSHQNRFYLPANGAFGRWLCFDWRALNYLWRQEHRYFTCADRDFCRHPSLNRSAARHDCRGIWRHAGQNHLDCRLAIGASTLG